MERTEMECNNRDFIKATVNMAQSRVSENKLLARGFLNLLNNDKIDLTPAVGVLKIGVIKSTVSEKIVVFVPFPFLEFVGGSDPVPSLTQAFKKVAIIEDFHRWKK